MDNASASEARQSTFTNVRKWIGDHKLITLIGIVAVAVLAQNTFESDSPPTTSNPSSTNSSLSSGQNRYVRSPGGSSDEVPVLVSENALDRFIKASIASDTYGMAEIMSSGGGFFIPSGTKVLILDTNAYGKTQFRILEGEHTSETAWLPDEFLMTQ